MIAVTHWRKCEESDWECDGRSIGGFGGDVAGFSRWAEYIDDCTEYARPYVEAIRASCLENNIRITGAEHQHGDRGIPIFSDGKIGAFSYRGWGDLMAAIWCEPDSRHYDYMDFYQ